MSSSSTSRLKTVLTGPSARALMQVGRKEFFSEEGAVNKIKFAKSDIGVCYPKDEKKPEKLVKTKLALSSVEATVSPEYIASYVSGYELLLRKKVPFDFIHSYLFFDDKGSRISLRASRDLASFMMRKDRTLDMAAGTRLVAQVVLAVFDYHSHDLVHRDIKRKNFLVVKCNGHYFCKLADHDTTVEVSKKGFAKSPILHPYWGTEGYMSPEMVCEIIKGKKSIPEFNMKAADCYALGVLINDMLEMLKKSEDRDKMRSLVELLIPATRNIEQVMQHEIFGKTPAERKAYFARIRAEAQQPMLIDGYLFSPPEKNNLFYLLDKSIKPLYAKGMRLAEKLEENAHFKAARGLEGVRSRYQFAESLRESTSELSTLIDAQCATMDKRCHPFLLELKNAAQADVVACEETKPSESVILVEAVQSAMECFKWKLLLPDVLKQDQRMFSIKPVPDAVKTFCARVEDAVKEHRDPEVIIRTFLQMEEKDELLNLFRSILQEKLKMLPQVMLTKFLS